jgi:lipopolysaccharide export system protein LptA
VRLLLILLLGCVVESPGVASPEVEFTGLELEDSQGNRVLASRGTMEPDGRGQGWEVQANLRVEGGTEEGSSPPPELKIEAEHSQWDLKARTVRFDGDVRTTRGEMYMVCARLDVRLGEGDSIESAVAEGEIRVTHGKRIATGNRAELFAKYGELIITGNPVVVEGGNSLAGERITLWLDDDRMDCEACTLVMENPGIGTP